MIVGVVYDLAHRRSFPYCFCGAFGVAVAEVAAHLRRYWEPRMRAQMITYCEQRQGAGLHEVARKAVGQLAAQAQKSA